MTMRQIVAAAGTTALLAGCTGVSGGIFVPYLESLIGQPVAVYAVREGPPDGSFTTQSGPRAFQWVNIVTTSEPGQVQLIPNPSPPPDFIPFVPSVTTQIRCTTTLYATPASGQPSPSELTQWIIVDYDETPGIKC